MSKRVAREYLMDVSEVARSLTVYFTTERDYDRLVSHVSHIKNSRLSHCRGFDHVTFLTQEAKVLDSLKRVAAEMGLEIDLN